MLKKLSKTFLEEKKVEIAPVLTKMKSHFDGRELHGGDHILVEVNQVLEEIAPGICAELRTVTQPREHALIDEVVLGTEGKGSFRLRVYIWRYNARLSWYLQPILKY